MTDIGKLREELDVLDRLIDAQAGVLDRLLWQQGSPPDVTTRYPASLKAMQEADIPQRALHQASSRLNELCWQREIKREMVRLLERAGTPSANARPV